MNVGDMAQVLSPFDKQHSGQYLVVAFNEGGGVTLLVDGVQMDFDSKFLQATGKTGVVPQPKTDPIAPEVTKSTIKEALFGGGDPVDNIAALFGVK